MGTHTFNGPSGAECEPEWDWGTHTVKFQAGPDHVTLGGVGRAQSEAIAAAINTPMRVIHALELLAVHERAMEEAQRIRRDHGPLADIHGPVAGVIGAAIAASDDMDPHGPRWAAI